MATQTFPQAAQPTLLRRALQADGVFCTLSGLLLIADAGPIASTVKVRIAQRFMPASLRRSDAPDRGDEVCRNVAGPFLTTAQPGSG